MTLNELSATIRCNVESIRLLEGWLPNFEVTTTATHLNASKDCRIYIHPSAKIKKLTGHIDNGTILIIGPETEINLGIDYSQGGFFYFGKKSCIQDLRLTLYGTPKNGILIVGENSHINGGCHILMQQGTRVLVGKDCALSYNLKVRTGEGHSIFDRISHKKVNISGDVIIGNHVWVGENCYITKRTTIGDNCVIGTRSFVSGSLHPHGLYAGTPARLIRNNIVWTLAEDGYYNVPEQYR